MIDRIVVINDDADESGGAAAIALLNARMMADLGYKVTLIHGSGTNPPTLPGVDTVSIGTHGLMDGPRIRAAFRGLFNPLARHVVHEWISSNDTPRTVYHLHNWHKVLSPSVFMALRPVMHRLVMTAHDYFLTCPNGGQFDYQRDEACERQPLSRACLATNCDRRHYAHKLWRTARQSVRNMTLDFRQSAPNVIAVHEGMRPYLVRGGILPASIRVVRNPVTPWTRTRIHAEHNREILYVGRLERDKGVDVIAAAARAADVPLRIIGDGPLAADLARFHPETMRMGWRTKREIADMATKARLVVVPTRWRETFGLVTLEAVSSGLPVLVSRHALISDEIVASGAGELCDPGDQHSLSQQLLRLSRDDELLSLRSEMAFAAGRRLAPTPAMWCEELECVYEDILGTTTAPPASRKAVPTLVDSSA